MAHSLSSVAFTTRAPLHTAAKGSHKRVSKQHRVPTRAHAHDSPASTSTTPHGHGHGSSADRRPGEKKGFVEEMRFVAMKLHTREQAPKEGEKKPEPKPEQQPMAKWEPTKEGYLKFLVESKVMYEAMEQIVASGASPQYAAFKNTGLERTEGLKKDIAWFEKTHGLKAPVADGPGSDYAEFLVDLSTKSPPQFICHFYNVYFAHSAGGKMIGRKVSEMILDGKELEFYKWNNEGGLESSLTNVKSSLNAAAEEWSRDEKDACLEETGKSFQMSGKLLRLIA